MLKEVKTIMTGIQDKLDDQDSKKLNTFLKNKISELETEKRELVGVFGKTGAGKSSLINAVIGEKDLLPSGDLSACTTVMIKVEANTKNQNYEAEIEFITKEEYDNDLWYCKEFHRTDPDNGEDHEDDDDDDNEDDNDEDDVDLDDSERLPALYGQDWERIRSLQDPWTDNKNKEIRKMIESGKKTISFNSSKELSEELVKYTRRDPEDGEGGDAKKYLWPLVKCVTVRVPNNELLQHVTLVDLPGSGDRNKIRDKMWREVVGDCSTVWIVTEIKRAESEKEAWDILKNTLRLMGNGGQCQQIHFICTLSDFIDDVKNLAVRNNKAKQKVKKSFTQKEEVQKHFSQDCFEVFTVSAKEFLEKTKLEPNETEIPKLQEELRKLNDSHSETLNYVSGAKGILSLIQGARSGRAGHNKKDVLSELGQNLSRERQKLSQSMDRYHDLFQNCLDMGVEKSKKSYEHALKTFLQLKKKDGRGFSKTLQAAFRNNGIYKTKSGIQKNLNVMLSRWLTESIEKEFRKTFPNESKPLGGAISSFSLDTKKLAEKYKDEQLQLEYLWTEEEKMKTKLNKIIRKRKKKIYNSLTATIEGIMQPCYDAAEEHSGTGCLERMRETVVQHVHTRKDSMFMEAQNAMLLKLAGLTKEILQELDQMKESIDLSLEEDQSLPDVKKKLEEVMQYYDQLKRST
ncbi:nuclear GTPase SLIP-GC-like isoform X2 [Halichoeres trimaculatus]